MASRSLNKVQLIGNLTRDPELRYTPQGTAVCNFGLATNRSWTNESGETNEEAEFHRIVAWSKLAEICAQFLFTGRRVYIEGRLQTRDWQTKDGQNRQTTEIVANEMIILDSKRREKGQKAVSKKVAESKPEEFEEEKTAKKEKKSTPKKSSQKKADQDDDEDKDKKDEEITEDDIPF